MLVWLLALGPAASVERALRLERIPFRLVGAAGGGPGLGADPEGALLVIEGSPSEALAAARSACRRSARTVVVSGPFDARLLAELRPLAGGVADRRGLGRAGLARLVAEPMGPRADEVRARARALAIAAALAQSEGNIAEAGRCLATTVQLLRRELDAWRDAAAFLG